MEDSNIFHRIVPCTTRPPRENEINGIQYYFISEQEFFKYLSSNQILDSTKFKDWFYGTRDFDLSNDKINIGAFNPAGVKKILKNPNLDVKVIRLKVNPVKRMQRSLLRETSPDVTEIARRFLADEEDFKCLDFKNYVLSNETIKDLELNIEQIKHIVLNWADYD